MSYETLPAQDDEHVEALMRLWRENMSDRRVGSVLSLRRRWLYDANPAGRAVTSLVRETKTGRIMGAASAYPRMFQVGDRVVKAGILADFVVEEGHRVAGPAIMVQRAVAKAAMEAGFGFLCGYPNRGAAPIFLRLRYKKIGETVTWVKLLKAGPQLEKFVNPVAARLAGLLLDRILDANDLRLAFARPAAGGAVPDPKLDARFDDLWRRGRVRDRVAGVRDAAYLRWRYAEHPTRRYELFATERKDGKLHGYVVYRVQDGRVFLEDLFCDGGSAQVEALLLRFCRRMRHDGHASVVSSYVGAEGFFGSLASTQFMQRPGRRVFMAYVDKSEEALRDSVYDVANWAMHDGELDI